MYIPFPWKRDLPFLHTYRRVFKSKTKQNNCKNNKVFKIKKEKLHEQQS